MKIPACREGMIVCFSMRREAMIPAMKERCRKGARTRIFCKMIWVWAKWYACGHEAINSLSFIAGGVVAMFRGKTTSKKRTG
jgi:hypothetical protein